VIYGATRETRIAERREGMKIIPERIIPEYHLSECGEDCPHYGYGYCGESHCNQMEWVEGGLLSLKIINGFPLECPLEDKEE